MSLTNMMADAMPAFDFGKTVERANNAFDKYQRLVRPVHNQVFDAMEKGVPVDSNTIEAMRVCLNVFEEGIREREAALAHRKESGVFEKEFHQEMASALTIARNAGHPSIMAHIIDSSSDEDLEKMFSLVDEKAKQRVRKAL